MLPFFPPLQVQHDVHNKLIRWIRQILYKLPPQMVRIIDGPLDIYVNSMQIKYESDNVAYIQDGNLQLPRQACFGS